MQGTPPRTDARILLLIAAALSIAGCSQQAPPQAQEAPVVREDIFGQTQPPLVPDRAHVHYTDIEPPIVAPSPPATPPEPLSARGQRAVKRALELRADQRFTEATIELEKALRYDPDHPRVHRELAVTQWLAGNTERMRTHVAATLAAVPDDIACHYLQGRLAARRFENEQAIRHYRTALACPCNASTAAYGKLAQYHLAETLTAENYLTAAVDLYKAFLHRIDQIDLSQYPNDELAAILRSPAASPTLRMAAVYTRLGDHPRAAAQYESAAAAAPLPAEFRLDYARALGRAGRFAPAAEQARAVVIEEPDAVTVLERIYVAAGTPDALLADLATLVEANPDDTTLTQVYVDKLAAAGETEAALALLRTRVEQGQADRALTFQWLDLQLEAHPLVDALDAAAGIIRRHPTWSEEVAARMTAAAAAARSPDAGAAPPADSVDFATAYLQGVLAEAGGDAPAAIPSFEWAINDEPTFVPARVALANLYLARHAWDDAIRTAEPAAVTLAPDTRLAKILGDAATGLDRFDEAARHYQRAIQLNRANVDAMMALAELYTTTLQPKLALRQYEEIVQQEPLNERARELLCVAYVMDDDPRAAAEQLTELSRLSAAPTTIARCRVWMTFDPDRPAYDEHRAILNAAMAAHRRDAETLYMLARTYWGERTDVPRRAIVLPEAIRLLEEALELEPRHRQCAELLAMCYTDHLDHERAVAWHKTLLERFPNRGARREVILELLMVLQRYDAAEDFINERIANESLSSETRHGLLLNRALVHTVRDDHAQAVAALEEAHDVAPDQALTRALLAKAYQRAGRDDRCMQTVRDWAEQLDGGLAVQSADRLVLTHLLQEVWKQMDEGQAVAMQQLLLEAIARDPMNDWHQLRMVEMLSARGAYDAAIALARENLVAARDTESIQDTLLDIYDRAERYDDAIELINRMMIELQGQMPQMARFNAYFQRIRLANVLVSSKRFDKAERFLNQWIRDTEVSSDPRERPYDDEMRRQYLQLLAFCHQEEGQAVQALEALRRANADDPTDPGICNDLAYSLVDSGRELDRSLAMARYAVAEHPRRSPFLDTLGWAYYKLGRFEEAKTWLHRARFAAETLPYRAAGRDPVVCDHLGDTCWRLGSPEEAIEWWTQSLAFADERIATQGGSELDRATRERVQIKVDSARDGRTPDLAPVGAAGEQVGPESFEE